MSTMKIVIEQSFASQVIDKITKTIEITPFNRGQRQMLEAAETATTIATGNIVLTDLSKVIQIVDPGGASRTITLPAEGINNHGFLIINTADVTTELITVKDDAGTTIGIVYPGIKGSWIISNGITWISAGGVGGEINDLSDVDTTGLADQNGLYYDSATQLWKPINHSSKSFSCFFDECITAVALSMPVNTSQKFGFITTQTSAANGDEYSFYIAAQKGTYSISLLGLTGNDQGKIDYYVDGSVVSSGQDWYSASNVYNVVKTITGISIPTTGEHTIKVKVNGKNASSSAYKLFVTKLWGWKTA